MCCSVLLARFKMATQQEPEASDQVCRGGGGACLIFCTWEMGSMGVSGPELGDFVGMEFLCPPL